ncbi:MAG: glycine/sarcosine/betaine reductase complex component C subunit beta [Cetobacterium sp.]
MSYAVLKNASYVLVHTPEMILHNGTTQTMEKQVNPNSEYLKNIRNSYRTFDEVVNYGPNQTYIGNMTPSELKNLGDTWVDKKIEGKRQGPFGEILPENEFLLLLKICDKFDLVLLEENFMNSSLEAYRKNPIFKEEDIKDLKGSSINDIKTILDAHNEGLYYNNELVGCIKKAHDIDTNLSSHTMLENLVVKASGVAALRHLIVKNNIDPAAIDYIIECSEEACGDMNQRGGGNFAKAIGEAAGIINATGCDIRGFCAAPTHALINAASLVKAGTYENVVIIAGGASAKLGMNGKDHVKKGLPILEDVLGAFAVLISKDDGVSPVIRTDLVGRHTVGTGSSPQAVMTSLIINPLEKAGLKVQDIDKYSVEMQNPDITKPAGAGDVPEGNYKMIGAIGVKRGDIERVNLNEFIENHGMKGWAPTQGHIPSGIPYCGFAIDDLTTGNLNKVMIVGKGSLFLGRMTNLFDGVSVIIERNSGVTKEETNLSEEYINTLIAQAMRKFAKSLLLEPENN